MQTVISTPLEVFTMPQYFEVPLFQRPYVWDEGDQWAPLWDDIRRMADLRLAQSDAHARHFLGAIVLQLQDLPHGAIPTNEVIDGQQRLTTLQLLFDASAAVFEQLGFAAYAARLNSLTRNDSNFVAQGMPLLKLKHTNKDRDAFLEIMDAAPPIDYDTLPQRGSRIARAHAFFASVVAEWLGSATDGHFARKAETLVGVLASGLQMVVITLGADENSQEIFETLNARGTPLTAADLIKNFVFQRLDSQGADTQAAYEKLWPFDVKFWESEVSVGRYPVSRSSLFLNQWLVSRTGEEVGLQSTFSRFKHFMEHDTTSSMLDVLREVRAESEQYQGWHEAAHSTDRRLDDTEMCYYRMAAVDSHALKPLLLWLHAPGRSLPNDQISKAVIAAESWMMRRAMLRLNSADSSRLVADLIRSLAGAPVGEVAERVENHLTLLTAASTYWPGDAELERALTAEPIYRKFSAKRLRPILEAVENAMRSEVGSEQVTRWSLAIEHVLPQSWHENWPVEGPEAQAYRDAMVHRLGNLTLLPTKLNSAVSNRGWHGKREEFQKHNTFLLNSRMLAAVDRKAWDEEAIERRTALMVRAILRTWPVPEGHVGEVVGARARASSSVSVADLVVAGLLPAGTVLRLGRSEFKDVTAKVCDDGDLALDVDGSRHGSPSGAAWAAMRRPTNGWYDWTLDDGRRLDDVRSVYLGKAQASSRGSFDWQRLHTILDAIPAGSWTGYGALAEALGTAAQPVAGHISSCTRCTNAHRVLQADGRVAPGFAWTDPADTRDPLELLQSEGLTFTDGVADVQGRLAPDDLLALAPGASPISEGTGFYRFSLGKNAAFLEDALLHGYVGTSWLTSLDLSPYRGRPVGAWHQELNALVKSTDSIESEIGAGLAVGQTWSLVEQLRSGDNVLVPTGRGSYRVAIIAGPYYFAPNADVPHRRPVDWRSGELRRDQLSEPLRLALQFAGTAQNLQKHSVELRELLEHLGSL